MSSLVLLYVAVCVQYIQYHTVLHGTAQCWQILSSCGERKKKEKRRKKKRKKEKKEKKKEEISNDVYADLVCHSMLFLEIYL